MRDVLKNREIEDWNTYLNLDESVVIPYQKLDNISQAVELFMKHFDNKHKIAVLVDSDPDGYCSAAMMYMYIKNMDEDYPVEYILHGRPKTHGLTDDIIIPDDIKLLIIPDAGTNDTLRCMALYENGIDILVLDHHEKEIDNPYALIVNNQTSKNYTNKNLCGAGIVYRFLQALDEENWNEFADDYLDLCALANISDMMDLRSFETRYFTNTGLLNIKNKLFKELIKAQDYLIKGRINPHNIQWSITPILNGMIRIGTNEEKELLFRAFIEQNESFEYKKRATKNTPSEVIQENIYERATRLCKNAKGKQDRQKDKSLEQIIELAQNIPEDNKVILLDTSDVLESGLTGVIAIKIAEIFNKPCILINKRLNEETKEISYIGSARNVKYSPIDSFKDVVNSTEIFDFGNGHANAFGVGLQINKVKEAIDALNEKLKDIKYDATYRVDLILDIDEMGVKLIYDLNELEDIVCQGIDEPMVAIENITLTRDCFSVIGKNEDTVSFIIDDIKYIQFKCKEGNQLYDWLQNAWDDNDVVAFNIVGTPSINEYQGVRTPQITIKDVSVTNINNEDW